jgi:hypothetical protein
MVFKWLIQLTRSLLKISIKVLNDDVLLDNINNILKNIADNESDLKVLQK